MLNFQKLFEFLFSSFRIDRDTELVEKITADGHRFALLVKHAWIYGVFSSLLLIPLILVTVLNVYLLGYHFEWTNTGIVLDTLLVANVAYTCVSSLRFLAGYKTLRQQSLGVIDVHSLQSSLMKADALFWALFNQLQTNFFFFVSIVLFYVYHIVFVSNFSTGLIAWADIVCIMVQLLLIRKFMSKMINLEMDFLICVPGKLYSVNQDGMYAVMQTLESDKIKTIRSGYPNFIASFFGYGNIEILSEGDTMGVGAISATHVEKPEETVQNMNALLSGKFGPLEAIHNLYLKKAIAQHSLNPDDGNFRSAVRKFLSDYESQIRTDYESGDQETKKEIESLYREYAKMDQRTK